MPALDEFFFSGTRNLRASIPLPKVGLRKNPLFSRPMTEIEFLLPLPYFVFLSIVTVPSLPLAT